MKDRCKETNPDDKISTLWDLVLVHTYLDSFMSTIKTVTIEPINTKRFVKILDNIDVKTMKDDFWKSINSIKK